MKSFQTNLLNLTATVSLSVFAYTYILLIVAGIGACQKNNEPEPKPFDGYAPETYYVPTNIETDGDYMLTGKVCNGKPRNIAIDVWYFLPTTRPQEDLNSIQNPGFDEDGELLDEPDPNESFDVLTQFTGVDGKEPLCNYDKQESFQLFLEAYQIAVVRFTDIETGKTFYQIVNTSTEVKGDVCVLF